MSVGDFRDLLGLSRKYLIPLLEHLDRRRRTRRVGDARVVE
jgi:selenocysteine-specific elongation factor